LAKNQTPEHRPPTHHITQYSKATQWKPGQSGNPHGNKAGQRLIFPQNSFHDLCEVWNLEGRNAMLETAKKQPSVFFGIAQRLIPTQVQMDLQATVPGNLSPADWADLRELLSAIQKALPDVAQRQPGEVFKYVREALAAAVWTLDAGKNKT
jgi:hypothetical protein